MSLPDGAAYLEGYVDESQAAALIARADAAPWIEDLRRRVQHYGWRYDYRRRRVREADRLGAPPAWLDALRNRLAKEGWFAQPPDQVIVNEYLPGQGIAPHVDCAPCFGPAIASLTVGSGAEMAFRRRGDGARSALWLAPGSLLILTGPARYDWTHGIAPRKSDLIRGVRRPRGRRLSFTFRQVCFGE